MSGDVPGADAALVWDDNDQQLVTVGDAVARVQLDAAATTAAFANLPTMNNPPTRTDAAVAVSGQLLWLSGGATANGCVLDDLWQLDLPSATWKNVWPATSCQGLSRAGGASQAARGAATARNDEGAGWPPATEE